ELVFIAIGTKTEILGNTEIEPTDGVRKRYVVKRLDMVAFAHGDETRASHGAFVESENQGAVVAGSVVSTGGMSEMMGKTKNLVTAEKLPKLLKGSVGRSRGLCAS